jgi:hypothetical protein
MLKMFPAVEDMVTCMWRQRKEGRKEGRKREKERKDEREEGMAPKASRTTSVSENDAHK